MKKNFLLSVFVVTGSVIAFTSCGGGASSYDDSNFLPNGTEENPYQIVRDPITIKVFAPHSAGYPEHKDLKMWKHLSKITNLNFEFTTPDTSAYTASRAAVWQSGPIPDVFIFNNSMSEIVQFVENGFPAYVPLTDDNFSYKVGGNTIKVGNIIKNYMPNYYAGMQNNFGVDRNKENIDEIQTLSDGNVYCTVSVKEVARDLTYKMFINQKWIDDLNDNYGLGLPSADEMESLDDYYKVLKAFKEYDANDNGNPNDEIPVTSKELEFLRNYILQAFGYVSYGCEIKDDWSAFDYVPMTDAYRNYLRFSNKLFAEGILHNKTFTITTDTAMAQYGQENLLGSFVAAAPYLITGYDLEANYTTIPPVRDATYTGPKVQTCFGNLIPGGATIPQNSIYPREVARLIDIMYSDLGAQLISYGVEGEDWTWDDDAHTSWTFNVPETWTGNQEQYRATITPNAGSGSGLYWQKEFVGKMNDDILNKLNQQSEIYTPYFKVAEPKEVQMNGVEYDKITQIKAALDPKVEYYEASFIKGIEGFDPNNDADWNKYLAELEGFQAKELLKCYNDALARYKAKKGQ